VSAISADELVSMRADATVFLPDTCTIQRQAKVDDGMGGFTVTWQDIATVACRLDLPRAVSEALVAEQLTSGATLLLVLPAGTDIGAADRVQMTKPQPLTLEVQTILPRATYEIHRAVACKVLAWAATPASPSVAPTITLITAGTVAAGSTLVSPSYPAGVATNRLAVMRVGGKPDTETISTPGGWTPFPGTDGAGGTGAQGIDTGPMHVAMFYRVLDGSESGAVAVSIPGGNSNLAVIDIYEASSGFDTPAFAGTTGADAAHDLAWSAAGATDLGLAAGDRLLVVSACTSNAAGGVGITSRAVTATGSTFGAVANQHAFQTNTGNDSLLDTCDFPVTGGPSSAAPVYSSTHDASNSGATALAKLVAA